MLHISEVVSSFIAANGHIGDCPPQVQNKNRHARTPSDTFAFTSTVC